MHRPELDADIRLACVLLGLGDPAVHMNPPAPGSDIDRSPSPFWRNHINPPAEPAPKEQTMEKHFAEQGIGYASNGYASNPCRATEDPNTPTSPVSQAIKNLRDEISEVHYSADILIGSIAPALRAEAPTNQESKARPSMASELAEEIQHLADVLRTARAKLVDARERVTL